MWYILLVGLTAQCLATQVNTYQKTSSQATSALSSAAQKNEWSWQEPTASASNQEESFHPLSFSSADASQQASQYTSNVQSASSGVAQALDQYPQQNVSIKITIQTESTSKQ